MTHAYFLRILEAELYGCPALYIVPVWAHIESLDTVPAVDAPHPGIDSIAFRFVHDLVGNLDVRLCSTRSAMGLAEIGQQHRRLIETYQALAGLPDNATRGQKCAAWAEATGMQGVIVDRSPGDDQCHTLRASRCVRATIDAYLAEWRERQAAELPPVIAGIATNVRLMRPACEVG